MSARTNMVLRSLSQNGHAPARARAARRLSRLSMSSRVIRLLVAFRGRRETRSNGSFQFPAHFRAETCLERVHVGKKASATCARKSGNRDTNDVLQVFEIITRPGGDAATRRRAQQRTGRFRWPYLSGRLPIPASMSAPAPFATFSERDSATYGSSACNLQI